MRNWHDVRVWAACAALWALSGVAEAKRVAVVLDSEGDEGAEPLVASAAENALTRAGNSLLETAQLYAAAPDADQAVPCADDACRQKFLGQLTVDEVVLVKARFGKDENGEVELWLSAWRVTPADGVVHGSVEGRCQKCGAANLIDYSVRDLMDRLWQGGNALPLSAPQAGTGLLVPQGGEGGEGGEAGALPPSEDTPPRRGKRFGPWKFVVLGAGVVALGTGIALIAMDKGPIDDEGNQRQTYRESKTPGIILAGGGGALLAAGIVLFVLDSKGGGEKKATTMGAAVVPGGAGFLVHGRF